MGVLGRDHIIHTVTMDTDTVRTIGEMNIER